MDSRLAVAQNSSSSLDDQNESKPLDEPGPNVLVGQTDKTSPSTLASSLQLFPITPVTSRQVSSINGETSKQASLKTCKSDGPKQPIIVKTSMPVLNHQPIRIKIIVRGKNPIISTKPTSPTKELCPSEFTKSAPGPPETAPLAGRKTAGETPCPQPPPAIKNERLREEAIRRTVKDTKAGSFDGVGNKGTEQTTEVAADDRDDDADGQQNGSTATASAANPSPISDESQKSPRLKSATAKPEEPRPAEEPVADREEVTLPLDLHKVDLEAVRGQVEVVQEGEEEEQTEPLDLSLPRSKWDADGRRWEDSSCESSLIMEVDEFEGEGDRDVVEEDDDDNDDDDDCEVIRSITPAYGTTHVDSFCDSILSPSFFSTSVFASLSSIDSDHDEFLFIDDQGIPYNLSPEGHKVPQIDTSKLDGGPLSGRTAARPRSDHAQGEEPTQLVSLLASNLSQSLGNPLHAPCDNLLTSLQTVSPPQGAKPSQAAELSTCAPATMKPQFSEGALPCQTSPGETGVVLPANQTVQILTNPSGNAPILLLSSPSPASTQFTSTPVGLSLPLSVTRSSVPSSAPMLLLLSSVSSSTGPSLALLDPSTGQLSQITATSSGPLPFPALSAGQLSTAGSALPSYPMLQLGASNASVVLSGVGNNLTAKPVPLTSSSSSSSVSNITPTLQTSGFIPSTGALKGVPPGPGQTKVSDAHVEAEVISKEGNAKPSPPSTSGSPPPLLNYDLTFDTLDPPSPQADPSSGSELGMVDPSACRGMDAIPLDDHLYFSSMGGPPSPSIFTSSQLDAMDPLDPLDPLSPSSSPNSLGPRKILYCQLCPRVFFYSSDLERHAITHSQKKPHVCQQCGKAFKRSSHLQRHKHIHTGQRNYVCPICAKRFREAGELQRHQRVHTGEKPYQCQLCHTRFAERNTLRRHTKRKHPYHQVAMEMLQERRRGVGSGGGGDDDRGGGEGRGGGIQMQQEEEDEEERAEWYSSAVSHLEDSESYMET